MRFINPLDDIFAAPSNVKVLRVLIRSDLELTGRQIAKLAGVNQSTCQRTLDRLLDLQILSVRRVVRAKLYRLRTGSLLVGQLLGPLFENEHRLLDNLLKDTAGHFDNNVISTIVFGSVAQGIENYSSDLDICLVVNDCADKDKVLNTTDEYTSHITDSTGIIPSVIVITRSDFKDRYMDGEPLIKNIVNDGQVYSGSSIESLISNYG